MDWSGCFEVERIPGKVSGAWLVKNSRVPADAVVDSARDGFTPQEIVAELFPGLTMNQVDTVLAYAKAHEAHPA